MWNAGLELFFCVFWVVAWVRMVEGNILFHAVSSALMDFIIVILSESLFCTQKMKSYATAGYNPHCFLKSVDKKSTKKGYNGVNQKSFTFQRG